MIRQFERTLTKSEKQIIRNQVVKTKSTIPGIYLKVILLILLLVGFSIIGYVYSKIWLIIILSIISLFIVWYLYYEILELIRLPKFLKNKQKITEDGVVKVYEINIDRYIKIENFEDEGDHFIIEFEGMLTLIGGQEFLGVRKLKNKIEQIEIMDSRRTGIYFEKIKKSGKSLNPYYTFKNGISNKMVESEIWENLTNRKPFKGKLEKLDIFIN